VGRGGHNAKPAETKRAQGNPGKRAINEPALIGARKAPPQPRSLSAKEKTVWKELVPQLDQAGILQTVDGASLESLVTQIVIMRDAKIELRKGGVISKGSKGQLRKHPALQIINDSQREIRAWCERFGLDPAARGKLTIPNNGGRDLEDELDDQLGNVVAFRQVK
jgi:P27 family predicted phage terminase small subunit